jgi:hypothetical protein
MVVEAYAYGVGLLTYIFLGVLIVVKIFSFAKDKDTQNLGRWFLYGVLLMLVGWVILLLLP